MEQALVAAGRCEQAYLTAPSHIKRQINQGFFEKLFIGEDGTVESAELTEPFAALLRAEETTQKPEASSRTRRARLSGVSGVTFGERIAVTDRKHTTTPGEISLTGRGVNNDYLVERKRQNLNCSNLSLILY